MTELATIHHWPDARAARARDGHGGLGRRRARGGRQPPPPCSGAMPQRAGGHLRRRRAHRLSSPPADPADRQRSRHRAALVRHPALVAATNRTGPDRAGPDRSGARHALASVHRRGGATRVPPGGGHWWSAWAPFRRRSPTPDRSAWSVPRREAELAGQVGYLPASIDVPSGVQGALEFAFGEAKIPAVGLWARVPHYAAAMPYPAAVRGPARRAGPAWPTWSSTRRRCTPRRRATHQQIEQLIAGSEEHAALVRQLEAQHEHRTGTGRRPPSATCRRGTSWPPSSSDSCAASTS